MNIQIKILSLMQLTLETRDRQYTSKSYTVSHDKTTRKTKQDENL